MRKRNSVRRIDIKRLRLCRRRTACGWVTNMAYTHITNQLKHMAGMKHIAHLPIALTQIQFIFIAYHYSSRILPSMLKHQQTIVDNLCYLLMANDSYNSTHG